MACVLGVVQWERIALCCALYLLRWLLYISFSPFPHPFPFYFSTVSLSADA